MNPELPYLHQPNGVSDWSDWPVSSPQITKMVIGKLDENCRSAPLPNDFAARFPNLKLLHLWGLEEMAELPGLPTGLQELDVRKCGELERLPELPEGLEVLVIGGAPRLKNLNAGSCGGKLVDLSVTDCPELTTGELSGLLERSIALEELDLSGCSQFQSFPVSLPESLVDLRCNRCQSLEVLPDYWPGNLRRLELSESAIISLPEFPSDLDYVNLSGCRKLTEIPQGWIQRERPRTLFLHGSGVQEPPASQHGEENENVAGKTRHYFREKELVGEGQVKRCKVLILGNGHAGKTTLNLSLTGKNPKTDNPGSTHGIQFAPWPMEREVKGRRQTLLKHIWDFGGQEIYHNTHQIFMKTGAVFLLLWDPTQDGKVPKPTEEGYADEWRSLRYWMDYLRLYGPRRPRVAVVCNCRKELNFSSKKQAELEAEFKRQMAGLENEPSLYFADSYEETGDLDGINEWIESEVLEVIKDQGSKVPAYWELAQDMVEEWVEADSRKEMSFEEFQEQLQIRLDQVVEAPGKFHRLSAAIRSGNFELNDKRVASTLGFLTNSGWIYWDEHLFQERVIISQKWALEAIYAALDRRPGNTVYETLLRNEGRFTRETLEKTKWGELGLTDKQEELLLSYIEQIGNCFTLIDAKDRWFGDAIYVSLAHLKTVGEQGWERHIQRKDRLVAKVPKEVSSDWLHPGHWHRILAILGSTYGREGHYAKDGFFLDDPDGQTVLLRMAMDEKERGKGIGGRIEITVQAETDEMTRKIEGKLLALVEEVLPRQPERQPRPHPMETDSHPAGPVPDKIRVFVSYAWNPQRPELKELPEGLVEPMTAEEAPDYEGPVDEIEGALRGQRNVHLLRDKNEVGDKGLITEFVKQAKKCDRVLVVHSEKYWKSAYCLFEFWSTWQKFSQSKACMQDTLILVELEDSGIFIDAEREGYRQVWKGRALGYQKLLKGELTSEERKQIYSLSACLTTVWPREELFRQVDTIFSDYIRQLQDVLNFNKRWSEESKSEVLDWIREEIGVE